MKKKKRFKRNKSQRTTTINIAVDQNGNLVYTDEHGLPAADHTVKKPRPGEKVNIIWWAEDAAATLTIDFGLYSPCQGAKFKSKGFVRASVREDVVPGYYKYAVVYSVGGTDYTDDPQIIIN